MAVDCLSLYDGPNESEKETDEISYRGMDRETGRIGQGHESTAIGKAGAGFSFLARCACAVSRRFSSLYIFGNADVELRHGSLFRSLSLFHQTFNSPLACLDSCYVCRSFQTVDSFGAMLITLCNIRFKF